MEYKISYRQVGKEKGFLHPPRFLDDERERQSIAERDAFGNRTQRFTELTNDSPPPGAYYRPSTLERDARWCGSVSSKGYCGGFVSAVPRFRDVKMLQQAHLPGPGSYNAPTGVGSEGARLVSFSNLNRDRELRQDLKANVPGPGEYNIDRKRHQRGGSGPTSSFLCQRVSLPVNTKVVTPAPGDYEVNRVSKMKVDKKGIVLRDHFFRSGTKRDLAFISPNEGPGPGEYDVDRGPAVTKEPIVERGQSAMGDTEDGNSRQIGRSRENEFVTPGPGWYTPHQTRLHEKSSSSSSVFLSRTKRFARSSVTRAPGPAFYQPEPLEKKSFRWNAKRQWA